MKKINALQLRQSLGKVLKALETGGAPIQVERHNKTVAVLVSLKDYKERFADRDAFEERQRLVREIHEFRQAQKPTPPTTTATLRKLRTGA